MIITSINSFCQGRTTEPSDRTGIDLFVKTIVRNFENDPTIDDGTDFGGFEKVFCKFTSTI